MAIPPKCQTEKKYPDAELDFLGMDAQEGEFLSLKVLGQSKLKTTEIIDIAEGRIELIKFSTDWQQVDSAPEDADNIWDADQMISNWSSDD